jgi:hypothetical protein
MLAGRMNTIKEGNIQQLRANRNKTDKCCAYNDGTNLCARMGCRIGGSYEKSTRS